MPIKKRSVKSSAISKKTSVPKQRLGDLIITGLEEGIRHARGETVLKSRTVYIPEIVDIRAIREKAGLSQADFAGRYGFNPRTLQEWEQGRARPESAIRAYLLVIDREHTAVERALHAG